MDGTVTNEMSTWSCLCSYAVSLLLALIYVGSLYVWKIKEINTHPSTIKRRFISVTIVCIMAPFYVSLFIDQSLLKDHTLWEILGIRFDGIIIATILPLILTIILFLGPISMLGYSGLLEIYIRPLYWLPFVKDLNFLRVYVVAPCSEEFVFRASILSLLITCTSPSKLIFIVPVFFGAAHMHHIKEQVSRGVPFFTAFAISSFQFVYTTIFGAYSAFLFLRTGHIIAPIIVHSFCNHMGFPDFGALFQMPKGQKSICIFFFVFGLLSWIYLLYPCTEPQYYSNNLPWATKL